MSAERPHHRRVGVHDLRDLLRPFKLDRDIRHATSNPTWTTLVFEHVHQAERAAALIAEAWGADKVVYVPGEHHRRVQVVRDIDRYGTWPSGWRRHPLDQRSPSTRNRR